MEKDPTRVLKTVYQQLKGMVNRQGVFHHEKKHLKTESIPPPMEQKKAVGSNCLWFLNTRNGHH